MAADDFTATQIEMLGRRWREDPSPHLSLQLADLYRQNGRIDEALPVLEKGLESYPESVSVRVALGRYRMEAGEPGEAAEALREVVDRDPGHLVANKLLVRAHLALGEYQAATDRLALYSVLNDGDPELESLRAAVSGRSSLPPLATPGAGGAEPFASPPASPAADLSMLPPPPGGRTLAGAVDPEPLAALLEPLVIESPFTGIFAGLAEELEVTPEPVPRTPMPAESAPAETVELDLGALEDTAGPEEEAAEVEEVAVRAETEEVVLDAAEEEAMVEAAEPDPTTVETKLPELEIEEDPVPEPAASVESEPEVEPVELAPEGEAIEPPSPAGAAAAATATLGALYLAQGHLDDAEATFRQVLERDPQDAEALAGLAEIEGRRSSYLGDDEEAGEEASPKVTRLREYLGRIRAAAERLA